MSYRSRSHREYDVRRMHLQFRSVWEQALKKAPQIISDLRGKGWDVDEDFYFSSQAEREARELEREGYVVQKQPVVKWGGEEICILAYKPSPSGAPSQPAAAPKEEKAAVSRVDPEANFMRIFWGKKAPPGKYVQNGVIIGPDRAVAFVRPDSTDSLAVRAREAIRDATTGHGTTRELDYQTLLSHEKNGKKYITILKPNIGYNIEKVKKAIRVFKLERSKTRRAKAYVSYQTLEDVLIVTDGSENKVLIAPVHDPSPALSTPL